MIPNLHIFNPSCETAIANGTVSYIPNNILLTFEHNLSYLPSIFANNNDLVLMPEYEELSHIELLHSYNFPVPGQILQNDFFEEHQKIISEINNYKLWGYAPNWIHRLKKNKTVNSPKFEASFFYNWSENHKQIYSRTTAKGILENIIENQSNPIYITKSKIASVFTSVEQIEAFLINYKQIVLKEPWSSSGRGILMLRKSNLNSSITQRIKGILKQQNYIMAEAMLDKKLDLALHFKITNGKVEYFGDTYFSTNTNGQYQANFINRLPDMSSEIKLFLESNIKVLQKDLLRALAQSEIPKYYDGFLGVDVMIVKENDKLVFQPCVEINLRNNMGTIALHLQKLIHPEAKGTFNIVFNPKQTFEAIYKQINRETVVDNKQILRGTLALISPKGKRFGAYISLD